MEKRKPHHPLATVKALVEKKKVRSTFSALAGAAELGLGFEEVLYVVMKLEHGDFYKSMTTHADNKIWQDVYRPSTQAGKVYLKLTIDRELLIVSFKEL